MLHRAADVAVPLDAVADAASVVVSACIGAIERTDTLSIVYEPAPSSKQRKKRESSEETTLHQWLSVTGGATATAVSADRNYSVRLLFQLPASPEAFASREVPSGFVFSADVCGAIALSDLPFSIYVRNKVVPICLI